MTSPMYRHMIEAETSGVLVQKVKAGRPVTLPGSSERELLEKIEQLIERRRMIAIGSVASATHRLRHPIFVEVVQDEGQVVISNDELLLYAVGETESAAIGNFRSVLLDDFSFLVESEESLGPDLRTKLLVYRDILEELAR